MTLSRLMTAPQERRRRLTRSRKSHEKGPGKELRGLQRCYYKSGPITKTRGPLMSLANEALPEGQRLPLTMMKTDQKGSPRLRQPQSLKLLKSLQIEPLS